MHSMSGLSGLRGATCVEESIESGFSISLMSSSISFSNRTSFAVGPVDAETIWASSLLGAASCFCAIFSLSWSLARALFKNLCICASPGT